MTYQEAIDFLFESTPMFQNIGAHAYKPGLQTVTALSDSFGSPHKSIKTVHVAGTNGKGSTSSLIAASLTAAGYKTGLYTSPHLIDFRERIRIDGEMISEEEVCAFMDSYLAKDTDVTPSFFELTTVMAFDHFARHNVDIAVIEVGLGGRLDSTNVITPELSIITNISKDHTALLGNTLPEIAGEKAGIIKEHIPVIIGEAEGEVRKVFTETAALHHSPITFASDGLPYDNVIYADDMFRYTATPFGDIDCQLTGSCQPHNAATALLALKYLKYNGFDRLDINSVKRGFSHVSELSGLAGRWMTLSDTPHVICDTGHNAGGWQYLSRQLADKSLGKVHMVIGFVNDKDISTILSMMPVDATYYFTQASVKRALSAEELHRQASSLGLHGSYYPSVKDAFEAACQAVSQSEEKTATIFVGGSTFVVADMLALLSKRHQAVTN